MHGEPGHNHLHRRLGRGAVASDPESQASCTSPVNPPGPLPVSQPSPSAVFQHRVPSLRVAHEFPLENRVRLVEQPLVRPIPHHPALPRQLPPPQRRLFQPDSAPGPDLGAFSLRAISPPPVRRRARLRPHRADRTRHPYRPSPPHPAAARVCAGPAPRCRRSDRSIARLPRVPPLTHLYSFHLNPVIHFMLQCYRQRQIP
ncbi:hypothetical protein DFH09DRAFT_356801 [Mycena vulgaris]|nr:hypothetical protein DFH09DRAFT_356801 [Mycena vulgaris]